MPGARKTAEQKRNEIKARRMAEGPRPKQVVVLVVLWVGAFFLAMERLASTVSSRKEGGTTETRSYSVKELSNSTSERVVTRDVDLDYCPMWKTKAVVSDFIVWALLVPVPIFAGLLSALACEILSFLKR